jgi:uncharacterized protein (TIGR02391 family)
MNALKIIKDTKNLIRLISKSGKTISNKKVKEEAERWVADYYRDLSNNLSSFPKAIKALKYLIKSVNNQRLVRKKWLKNLGIIKKTLKSLTLFESKSAIKEVGGLEYSFYRLHPKILKVSKKLFRDEHYPQAVEEAFKKVIKEVKQIVKNKTGRELDGDSLMNHAFGCDTQTPIIKFNSLQTREEKDEQRGIMYLFKGIVGIRNRKAHDNVNLSNPYRAFEYLALASLLMRLLDKYAK